MPSDWETAGFPWFHLLLDLSASRDRFMAYVMISDNYMARSFKERYFCWWKDGFD